MFRLHRLASFAVLACLLAVPASAQTKRIAFLFGDGNMPGITEAYKRLLAERPDLRGKVTVTFLTESVFNDVDAKELTNADVLVFDTMNQGMLERFNTEHKVDLVQAVRRRGTVVAVGEGLVPKEQYQAQGVLWDDTARAFWANGGLNNQLGLMKFAALKAGVRDVQVPAAQPSLDFGYYYPDGDSGQIFATWDAFDAWRASHGKRRPGAPRVAIGFYRATYYTGDTALLNAVIAEVEKQGAEAIPAFGYPGAVAFERLLLDANGQRRADVGLGFIFNFSDFNASKALAKVDIPVINLISLYGRSEKEWRTSATGLTLFEGTFQVAVPELAGTVAPIVVGSKEKVRDPETGITMVVTRPVASRVSTAVARGLRYAALRAKSNHDKRVALIFYDYPPGKANIGASYLNVAESLSNILRRLAKEGYDIGNIDPSPDGVLSDLAAKARNVGGYAPGELDALVAEGSAIKIPMRQYRQWLNELAPALKAKVLKDWGPPEQTRLMTVTGPDGPSLIVPLVQYGNIVLMPQPARGWGENQEQLYHAKDLAPHHQYFAAYAWLRHQFKTDAVVHIGTHGTLEWLDGKDMGLSEEDAPDALIADMPDVYIYNVDVVGEGLVARRRGMATLVDHMVPPFKKGGLLPELVALTETINDYDQNESKNPELATAYADQMREQVNKLGLAKDLGLTLTSAADVTDEVVHKIEDHLILLKGQNIPYGLHAFGRTPEKALRDSTIDAIVSADRSLLPNNAKVLADEMEQRITASGPRELDDLVRALGGGFVPAGGGGEPIRNPDSYPTGKNFYGIDPDKVPKPAAWALGLKLADQMLSDHVKKHGRYPEKISFVIWGDETMRHEGVLESQIFYLLGTKPVWDARGKVVGFDVIPSSELHRPRVDVVIACAAEGMFYNVTRLMDAAVQKVKAIEENDNYVRRHYLTTKRALEMKGYTPEEADKRAGVRIFDEPPGIFNLNTSTIAAESGTWDTDKGMADDYLRKLGHGFGNGFWGEPMEDVFRMALSGTDTVVHSNSTMLYGAFDNDDMFMYMGGLANAIRNIDGGKEPELVVTNTRDPGHPEMTSMDKFIGTEFRSRYVNPTWIEGQKKEGYAGAGAMRKFVEYMWGWDAVTPELVDDGMWKETFDVYVQDKDNLGMKQFFEQKSPFAYQDITARMIETIRKGYWKADAATETTLLSEYLENVNAHGVGCAEFTCGNPRLSKYVMERARLAGIPVPAIEGFQRAMERATRSNINQTARAEERFVARNEAQMAARLANPPRPVNQQTAAPKEAQQAPSPATKALQGYLMEQQRRDQARAIQRIAPAIDDKLAALLMTLPMLALLLGWRWRRRRA